MRAPIRIRTATAVLAALTLALPVHAARLDYRGTVLPERQVESLARAALRAPGDAAAASQLVGAMVQRLQALGHLDAHVEARWDTVGEPVLRIAADEGAASRLRAIRVRLAQPEDSARIAPALGLVPGMRASTAAVGEALMRALTALSDEGYPYARLGITEWRQDSGAVDVVIGGAIGPPVTVTEVRIEGLAVTSRGLVDHAMGPLAGHPFDRSAAFAAAERLQRLGLFTRASYEGLEGESDWSRGQLVYRVTEPAYNRFEGVVGVQGEAGTVGLARLDLGNLGGTGRGVHLGWEQRGKGLADLRARYREPLLFGWPVRLEAAVEQQLQDTIYTRTRWGVRGRFSLGAHEGLEAGYEQERVVQEDGPVEQATIQNTVFALERIALDDPRAARRGTHVRLEAGQAFKRETLRPQGTRTARASAVRLIGDWHRPLGRAHGLSLGLQGAGRFSTERILPLYERYPLGGASTLRGFDEEALHVDKFALSRLEWRFFLDSGAQHVYLFWDHAETATREPEPAGGDRLVHGRFDGLGAGLRLAAAGGVVGIDYGLEPGRPFLEGKVHLQLVTHF